MIPNMAGDCRFGKLAWVVFVVACTCRTTIHRCGIIQDTTCKSAVIPKALQPGLGFLGTPRLAQYHTKLFHGQLLPIFQRDSGGCCVLTLSLLAEAATSTTIIRSRCDRFHCPTIHTLNFRHVRTRLQPSCSSFRQLILHGISPIVYSLLFY
jgi:hypothetical protein